jgi:hypothetical protein
MGGFNLRVGMANFRLAPEHTGGEPVFAAAAVETG